MPRTVSIHYRRLPEQVQIFKQLVLEETAECVVTFMEEAGVSRPVVVGGRVILEPGASVVWFTYPERWYDIGLFHRRDGTFTGWYANILTPVRMHGDRWDTTDLCLDVWADETGEVTILDQEEFTEAVARGWMDESTARTARAQANDLADAARGGLWPPVYVRNWTLERARSRARELWTTSPESL